MSYCNYNSLGVIKSRTGKLKFCCPPPSSGAPSSVAWGSITGTLSNQSDLQSALNLKVTGTGTTNFLPLWSSSGVLSDSMIKYDAGLDKMIISLNEDFEFFTGGKFSTKFIECTQDTRSTFAGAIRTKNIEVGFTSGVGAAPLDVQKNTTGKAAVFRGGVIIARNLISNIQVDDTSMVIGSGSNDIISGSDHCLAVGNGNQIINNADNSFATGVRNVIDGLGAGQPARSQVFGYENELTGSFSSFIAGGQNIVTTSNTAMVLGYENKVGGTSGVFAFGAGNTFPLPGSNAFMIGNGLEGLNGTLNIGFRNNISSYPNVNYARGLGNTKVVISTGTDISSNAIIITEGGVTRGGGVNQVPRIVMPTIVGLNFTNDAGAAGGGIPIGGLYHDPSGVVRIRLT